MELKNQESQPSEQVKSDPERKSTAGWTKALYFLGGVATGFVAREIVGQVADLVLKGDPNSQPEVYGQKGKKLYQDDSPASKLVESGQSLDNTVRMLGYEFDETSGGLTLKNRDLMSYALEKPDVKSLILANQTLVDAFTANKAVKEILATEKRNLTIDDLRKPEVMNSIVNDEPLMRTLLGNREIVNATLQDAAVRDLVTQDLDLVATCYHALQQNKHKDMYCDLVLQQKTALRTLAENMDLMRLNGQIEQNLYKRGLIERDTNGSCDPSVILDLRDNLTNFNSRLDELEQQEQNYKKISMTAIVVSGVCFLGGLGLGVHNVRSSLNILGNQ